MILIFDFKPGSDDEKRYEDFLTAYPKAIVVSEGEKGKPDRAHRASCAYARIASEKGDRWAKFCFPDIKTVSEIRDWSWIARKAPEPCKVCKP